MATPTHNINQIFAEIKDFTNKEVIALALDVTASLVVDTPKDTSWAANNWVPQVGTPFRSVVGDSEANPKAGDSVRTSNLSDIVGNYTIDKGDIYVSNNVPYIGRLNNGHSNQAPAGFVESSVISAVNKAKKFRLT